MSTKWFSGPPPSVGWWQASAFRNSNVLRWWNGTQWSDEATNGLCAAAAAKKSKTRLPFPLKQIDIEWKHRPKSWPERSHT